MRTRPISSRPFFSRPAKIQRKMSKAAIALQLWKGMHSQLMRSTNAGVDLYISCTMPCIEVGTVGGGTGLPAQAASLDLLGVLGPNRENPGANAQTLAKYICANI